MNNIKLKHNIPLSSLSTFGIGGMAAQFIRVSDPEELLETVQWAKENSLKYKVFAGGSNVVFPDEELDCLVIQFLGVKTEAVNLNITVDAGVLLTDVIDKSISDGLSGLERLSGIPGTIGGAVVGNAGAYGHSISEVVEAVEIWDGGQRKWITNNECSFSYRESIFKQKPYLVLRAVCKFAKADESKLKRISQDIVRMRQEKYKPGLKCPGSFFKNIIVSEVGESVLKNIDPAKIKYGKIPAGFLLGEVGAKGMRVGGIHIADFHGNLFINDGSGTVRDVKNLAQILKNKVREKFGIELEEEIRYL